MEETKLLDMERNIGELLKENKIEEAFHILKNYYQVVGSYTDIVAIYEATIYEMLGNVQESYDCIIRGLSYNPKNYELYVMLGNYYSSINVNQGYLCYENALFFCNNIEDKLYIEQLMANLKQNATISVHNTSIVILSYNTKELTQLCLDSIILNNYKNSYELVIVDNGSVDGSAQWLLEYKKEMKETYNQDNIKVILNENNVGFPKGCNQGIVHSNKDNDIFLLNSDTVVLPNSIFWLRMGLYEHENVASTGSVSNHVNNDQKVDVVMDSLDKWYVYGEKNNVPMIHPYERKLWLTGFALLFKRKILEKIGYLDEIFTPGNFEDNDIGYRILKEGYTQLLCKNSFIYHFGSVGFRKNPEVFQELLKTNREKLKNKYQLDVIEYCWVRRDIIDYIHPKNDTISILDGGCGLGGTLLKLESLYPHAKLLGIDNNSEIVKTAKKHINIIEGSICNITLDETYDYIILANVLEYVADVTEAVNHMIQYLSADGTMIISYAHIMPTNNKIKVSLDDMKRMFEHLTMEYEISYRQEKHDYFVIIKSLK